MTLETPGRAWPATLGWLLLCGPLLLCACAPYMHLRKTAADERVVYVKGDRLCAEPSPDVAKAMATSIQLATSLAAAVESSEIPAQGKLDVAGAFSRSQAESLAQLTERLATIQLLRDSLYRGCEAANNGLLDETSYAVALSRYDDTMITMLLGEFIAGNFGRELAVLGSEASGDAQAELGASQAAEAVSSAQAKPDSANEKVEEAEDAEKAAAEELAKCEEPGKCSATEREERTEEVAKTEARTAAAEKAREQAIDDAMGALGAAAKSSARALAGRGVGTPVAAQSGEPRKLAIEKIARIQRKYIENVNIDAFSIACISELSRDKPGERDHVRSTLARVCETTLPRIALAGAVLQRDKSAGGPARMLEACSEGIAAAAHGGAWISTESIEENSTENEGGDPSRIKKATKKKTEKRNAAENALLKDVLEHCNERLTEMLAAQERNLTLHGVLGTTVTTSLRHLTKGAVSASGDERGVGFDLRRPGAYKVVFDVVTVDMEDGNEKYDLVVDVADAASFASAAEVGRVRVRRAGAYEVPLSAAFVGAHHADAIAIRVGVEIGGTTPEILYGASVVAQH